ncbi:MAG: hypothetical protein KAS15_06800 [Nanoarchaeota archaeon]|nr:hypothetical protein [Nanoarchaeota archaeon]MCK5629938.1 hypothetical protein [Nanoarchaeota archaeon]
MADVEISGREAENYRRVLERIGYSTRIKRFNVDSRGYSPELRRELGDDYLDNRVIIASENQLKEISIEQKNPPYYMFDIISKIPKKIVNAITPYEALTGCVNLIYGSDSLLGIFDKDFKSPNTQDLPLYVNLALDTLEEDIKKIYSSQEKISSFRDNLITRGLKNLDRKVLEDILTETHQLTSKYGSIKEFNSRAINVNLLSFRIKTIFQLRHKSRNITVFNCKEPFLIYSGEKDIADNNHVKILHESEKSAIIDYKVKNQILEVKKELVAAMMESVAKSVLNSRSQGESKLTGFQFYKRFNKLKKDPRIAEDLKTEDWHLLKDFYFDKIEFNALPLEIKEKVTVVKDQDNEGG